MGRSAIRSLDELVEATREIHRDWTSRDRERDVSLWFRGVDDRDHALLPGLYRPDSEHLDEVTVLSDFESLAPLYLDREPRDQWDWYFTAQHYGLPTRLLDWTENLLVALYFAVSNPARDSSRVPCVWVIDPSMLNCVTIGPDDDSVIAPGGPFSYHWLPTHLDEGPNGRPVPDGAPAKFRHEGRTYDNSLPIAIMPRRATRRILAQQGMFTVHGVKRAPLFEVFQSAPPSRQLITRIDVDRRGLDNLRRDLRFLGMNRLGIFPEVQQIAPYLREAYAHLAPVPLTRPAAKRGARRVIPLRPPSSPRVSKRKAGA
jgi:hypothetical protein